MLTLSLTREMKRRLSAAIGLLATGALVFGLLSQGAPPTRYAVAPAAETPLRSVATNKKVVALTFDWSWGTEMGPKVMAILEKDHVPATFFLSGPWATHNPQLVQALVKDGFQIESHGWAHVNYSSLDSSQIASNIQKTDQALYTIAKVKPDMVRPPNGDYNNLALRVAASLGYRVVLWDTDSLDWMNPGVSNIAARVLKRAHPGDIILMHSSDTCKQTDLALPAIISGLRQKGYTFVTIDQLLADGTAQS